MTTMLDPDTLAERVDGLLHLDTQRAPSGLDLTAGSIFRLTGPGRVDFGGSELEAAGASHGALVVDGERDPLETLLTVGSAGCRLKENARVSRLVAASGG